MSIYEVDAAFFATYARLDLTPEETGVVNLLIDAAREHIIGACSLGADEMDEPEIVMALLAIAADLYEHRNANIEEQLHENPTVHALIGAHRKVLMA